MRRTLPWLALLLLAPATARPCSRPPSVWHLAETVPASEEVAPTDGSFVVFGEELFDDWSEPFPQVLRVNVTDPDGRALPGEVAEGAVAGMAVWHGETPFEPGVRYTASLRVENLDAWGDEEGETERTFTFVGGEGPSRAPAPPQALRPEARLVEQRLTECMREPEPGMCGWCEDERVVGHQQRQRVQVAVAVQPGDWSGAYVAELYVSTDPAELEQGRGRVLRQAARRDAPVVFDVDLGPRRDFGGDRICARGAALDPLGRRATTEVTCVPASPFDPRDDRLPDAGPGDDGGPSDDADVDGGPPDDGDVDGGPHVDGGCAADPDGGPGHCVPDPDAGGDPPPRGRDAGHQGGEPLDGDGDSEVGRGGCAAAPGRGLPAGAPLLALLLLALAVRGASRRRA